MAAARPDARKAVTLSFCQASRSSRTRIATLVANGGVSASLIGSCCGRALDATLDPLVDDGRVGTGCNVENAAYGVALCAECGLVSSLVAGGGGRLVAFTCANALGERLMPCGRCRQLLWEHGGADLLVDTPLGVLSMSEVLPQAFGAADIAEVTGEEL